LAAKKSLALSKQVSAHETFARPITMTTLGGSQLVAMRLDL
jgi:hypothetical protein